jgi:Fe-S-cluster containining protein
MREFSLADLDLQEMKMFAKWYGVPDLVHNDGFWRDCMSAYLYKSVILPVYDEPAEHEAVLNMVQCPPGACGSCCRHYEKIAMTQDEYIRLSSLNRGAVRTINDEKGQLYLDLHDGCQFLSNNICTVYAQRPGVCRSFPILSPRNAVTPDGQPCKQMQMRLECSAALEAIRKIFVQACNSGNVMLLPDLSLIPVYNNGNGILGNI